MTTPQMLIYYLRNSWHRWKTKDSYINNTCFCQRALHLFEGSNVPRVPGATVALLTSPEVAN